MTDKFELLSADARVVAGAHFGLLAVGKGTLSFGTPARISARGKAALVELEIAGVVKSIEPAAPGGVAFTPAVDCSAMFDWVGDNQHLLEGWYIVDTPDPRDTLVLTDGTSRPIAA
jgi:hypothetical protein